MVKKSWYQSHSQKVMVKKSWSQSHGHFAKNENTYREQLSHNGEKFGELNYSNIMV